MWTKLKAFYEQQLASWHEHQQQEFRQEELLRAYMLEERERLIAEAKAAEEKERAYFADRVARRVVEVLKEEGWITKQGSKQNMPKTMWIQE